MVAPDFDRVSELFTRAIPLDDEGRRRLLESECGDDAALLREVETMLRFDDVETPDAFTDSNLLEGRRALDRTATELLHGLPERIGPWRIGRRISTRTGESTFAAEHEESGALAWLVVSTETATDEVSGRIRARGAALAALRHPGLIDVLEVGQLDTTDGGRAYRLTAIPPGRNLWRHLSDRRPQDADRAELIAQVADALHHAHEAGFCHRGLEPRVVHVRDDGMPVIIDLGAALWNDSDLVQPTARALQHLAPEQAQRDAGAVGVRTDVHALGLMMHDALTGRPAFNVVGRRTHDAIRIVCEEPPPPLSRSGRSFPEPLEAVARRALAKDPAERFESAAAFAAALRRAAAPRRGLGRRLIVAVVTGAALLGASLAALRAVQNR